MDICDIIFEYIKMNINTKIIDFYINFKNINLI